MTLGPYRVERLTAVKAVLGDFLERRAGDRVGLLLFGLHAYAVTPLTLDRATVRQQLDDSVVGLAGQETAMGDAIALAVKRLRGQDDGKDGRSDGGSTSESAGPADRPVVILLTDGVNTAGAIAPDKAAKLAQAAGIRVHTIGFGGQDQFLQFFGMNARGRSDLDEATLRAIADTTGGRYFRARDTRELAGIYAELDRIEPVARAGEMQMPKIERYPLPLGLALAFALLGAGLRQRLFPV
jgi:Ca-activated chloride channel family protein